MAHPSYKMPDDTPEWGRVLANRFGASLEEAAKDREQADKDRAQAATEAAKDRAQAARDRDQMNSLIQTLIVLNNQIHRGQKRQTSLLERSLRIQQTTARIQIQSLRFLRQLVSGRNGRSHGGNGHGGNGHGKR